MTLTPGIRPRPPPTGNGQSFQREGVVHSFVTYATIRPEQYPEEGSQLMTFVDHILKTHAQKGPRVWLEYDYIFLVRGEDWCSLGCL